MKIYFSAVLGNYSSSSLEQNALGELKKIKALKYLIKLFYMHSEISKIYMLLKKISQNNNNKRSKIFFISVENCVENCVESVDF